MGSVLLVVGVPGAGKTTLAERVAQHLAPEVPRGFVTHEMVSDDDRRWGFRAETFDGHVVVLAHQRILSPHRAGRYGIDVRSIARLAERELRVDGPPRVVLIDELRGLMCEAPAFVARLRAVVESGRPLVVTVGRPEPPLARALGRRADVEVWEITPGNRDLLPAAVAGWIAAHAPRPEAAPPAARR